MCFDKKYWNFEMSTMYNKCSMKRVEGANARNWLNISQKYDKFDFMTKKLKHTNKSSMQYMYTFTHPAI